MGNVHVQPCRCREEQDEYDVDGDVFGNATVSLGPQSGSFLVLSLLSGKTFSGWLFISNSGFVSSKYLACSTFCWHDNLPQPQRFFWRARIHWKKNRQLRFSWTSTTWTRSGCRVTTSPRTFWTSAVPFTQGWRCMARSGTSARRALNARNPGNMRFTSTAAPSPWQHLLPRTRSAAFYAEGDVQAVAGRGLWHAGAKLLQFCRSALSIFGWQSSPKLGDSLSAHGIQCKTWCEGPGSCGWDSDEWEAQPEVPGWRFKRLFLVYFGWLYNVLYRISD